MKGPRCPEGAGMRRGVRPCLWSLLQDRREAGAPPSGQEGSGRIILPFWVFPPCLLSVLLGFLFLFLTEEGLAPVFPSIPLRTGRLQRRCGWLLPPPSSLPAITAGNSEVLSPLESGQRITGPQNSSTICPTAAGMPPPVGSSPARRNCWYLEGERDGRGLFQRSPVVFRHH